VVRISVPARTALVTGVFVSDLSQPGPLVVLKGAA
jgi:hypothetical protein